MKEHPILFSAPMVRAILEGRKTQTRRIIKPQPIRVYDNVPYQPHFFDVEGETSIVRTDKTPDGKQVIRPIKCPYGQPGGRLWVRETWAKTLDQRFLYRADTSGWEKADLTATGNWKPSIHMPRAASRITLEITDVRVERLQDISEADAVAEGAQNPFVWVVEFKLINP